MIAVGDIVKFKEPYADEIGLEFIVLWVDRERCMLEAIVDMAIRPTSTHNVDEVSQ